MQTVFCNRQLTQLLDQHGVGCDVMRLGSDGIGCAGRGWERVGNGRIG